MGPIGANLLSGGGPDSTDSDPGILLVLKASKCINVRVSDQSHIFDYGGSKIERKVDNKRSYWVEVPPSSMNGSSTTKDKKPWVADFSVVSI